MKKTQERSKDIDNFIMPKINGLIVSSYELATMFQTVSKGRTPDRISAKNGERLIIELTSISLAVLRYTWVIKCEDSGFDSVLGHDLISGYIRRALSVSFPHHPTARKNIYERSLIYADSGFGSEGKRPIQAMFSLFSDDNHNIPETSEDTRLSLRTVSGFLKEVNSAASEIFNGFKELNGITQT